MDSTLLRAGLTTHLKIVAVSLVAAVVVVAIGVNARTDHFVTARAPVDSIVVKAGQPATYAGQDASSIR